MNDEQQLVFDEIVSAVENQTPNGPGKFIFVQGPGGSGKTEMLRRVVAKLRSTVKGSFIPYLVKQF